MAEQSPLFSIAIPTFNRIKTLKRALNSALQQTYTNLEIVVLDNASDDGTANYLHHMAKQYPQINVIRQPQNIGMLANMQHIPQVIQGDYFVILSDDDYLLPEFAATAVMQLQACATASLWFCKVAVMDKQFIKLLKSPNRTLIQQPGEVFLESWLYKQHYSWTLCGVVFRTSVVNQYCALQGKTIFFDISAVIICAFGHDVLQSEQRLACYYLHGQNISQQHSLCDNIRLFKQIETDSIQLRHLNTSQQRFLRHCMAATICHTTLHKLMRSNTASLKERLAIVYTISKQFSWIGAWQLAKRLPHLFKRQQTPGNTYHLPAAIQNPHNYRSYIAFEYALLRQVIPCLEVLFRYNDDISLFGHKTFVTAGKLLAEHIQSLYVEDGLPKADVIIDAALSEKDLQYRRAYLYVQRLLQSSWGKSIKQQTFYRAGLTFRRQKLIALDFAATA